MEGEEGRRHRIKTRKEDSGRRGAEGERRGVEGERRHRIKASTPRSPRIPPKGGDERGECRGVNTPSHTSVGGAPLRGEAFSHVCPLGTCGRLERKNKKSRKGVESGGKE